ncbi:hypothetical protein [Elizabethkingia phage TCUEAP1]|nr:hypothetical protein [Elizabethkingia phage TCUEAP1]
MGITVKEAAKKKVKFQYPNLVVDERDGCIILCTDEAERGGTSFGGVLLHKPEGCTYEKPEGTYLKDWYITPFKAYEGSITYEND